MKLNTWTHKILNISHTQLLEMSLTKLCLLQCCWSPLVPLSHWAAPVCWPSRLTDASSSATAAHHQRHYWLDSPAPAGGEGGERRGGMERRREGEGKEEEGEKGKRKDVMIISKEVINQSTLAYPTPSLCETSCSTLQTHVCLTVLRTPLNKSL